MGTFALCLMIQKRLVESDLVPFPTLDKHIRPYVIDKIVSHAMGVAQKRLGDAANITFNEVEDEYIAEALYNLQGLWRMNAKSKARGAKDFKDIYLSCLEESKRLREEWK